MIYQQEQAIRQAARIEAAGARVLRVDYADIVEHTEKTCRDISAICHIAMSRISSTGSPAGWKIPCPPAGVVNGNMY